MKYWLAKQEPSGPRGYSFEQFKKDGKTVWDGVHNNLALKKMIQECTHFLQSRIL